MKLNLNDFKPGSKGFIALTVLMFVICAVTRTLSDAVFGACAVAFAAMVVLVVVYRKPKEKPEGQQRQERPSLSRVVEPSPLMTKNDDNKNSVALSREVDRLKKENSRLTAEIGGLRSNVSDLQKRGKIAPVAASPDVVKQEQRLLKLKDVYQRLKYSVDNAVFDRMLEQHVEDLLSPSVILPLQSLGIKDLRKRFNEIQAEIKKVFANYEGRYTTKANIAIYKLMVLALSAELQNILTSLKFGRLEAAENAVREMTAKYAQIATDGNQTIVTTVKTFIGEIECLFLRAVRVEYEYYTKREEEKSLQRDKRAQAKIDAEERRIAEAEKKKLKEEKDKFTKNIAELDARIASGEIENTPEVQSQRAEWESQMAAVDDKAELISNLLMGKAGSVYIISNVGSFGEGVFKIGMTRRLEPQDRVDELASASLPFPFSVHSFLFTDDAPELEHALHVRLNEKRVNKVNPRKEFFKVSLEELEALVQEIQPSAEFKRVPVEGEYERSLSASGVRDFADGDFDNEFDDEDMDE